MDATSYVLLFVLNPLAVAVAVALSRKLTKGEIMSDVQSAVDEVTSILLKAKAEIVSELSRLEAAVAAGRAPDLTGLRNVAAALDDLIPDAVVEEELVEEVEVEAPVEDA